MKDVMMIAMRGGIALFFACVALYAGALGLDQFEASPEVIQRFTLSGYLAVFFIAVFFTIEAIKGTQK